MAVWQMLLRLVPAFCVCGPSYVSVCHSPPYHDVVLASSWSAEGEDAKLYETVPRVVSDSEPPRTQVDGSSDDSYLSSLDMET